ncbi:MAG: aldehyde dehydrogenase family protein, partial [Candidatus Margulisiibacteriota bacterium]
LHTQAFDTKNTCEDKLIKLNHSFQQWKEQPMHDRQRWLIQLASNITKKKSKIATLISTDMGKPVTEALKEVDKCIQCCQFYAQKIDSITEKLNEENGQRLPVGVILGIMPWNFPIWQLIRFIVPAIIVGNTCAIKPAHNTFRVAASLLECSPKTNPIIDCIIPSDHDASKLIGHPLVAGVSFTGSVNVGRKIGQLAAEHFKPCVLELGGSDPYIIFENADLEPAISTAVNARFSNSGQTCISAKRFL